LRSAAAFQCARRFWGSVSLGVDAGGAEQRLLGLLAVRFQLGVLQIAARAGTVRGDGCREVAASFFLAAVSQRQQAQTLLRFGDLEAIVHQRQVLGGRLRARQEVGPREPRVRIGDQPFGKILFAQGKAGNRGGLKAARVQMALDLGFDFRLRLAERVAVGRVFRHALPQVEQQNPQLAGIFRIDHQQMHARPIEIGPWRGRSNGDVDADSIEGGEEFDQTALESRGHARGVGLEEQAGERAVGIRRDRLLFRHDDGVTAAPFGQRRRQVPALRVLQYQDAYRLRRGQVRRAQRLSNGMAELLKPDEGLPSLERPGVGEHLERPRGKLQPVALRRQEPGKQADDEQPPHGFHYPAGDWLWGAPLSKCYNLPDLGCCPPAWLRYTPG
jgi:hypothetical protein